VGASVEGELGCLGSLETGAGEAEDGHGFEGTLSHDQLLTDPEEAVEFVTRTQVDALAVAIGTSHGAYKFTKKPTGDVLAISRIRNSQITAQHSPGNAWFFFRSPGMDRHDQPIRWSNS
jgi:fructose-bisphosphate aldolase class II